MLLILLLIIVLTGCDNYNQYELEVIMPELPSHIKSSYDNIKFELKYPGAGGNPANYTELSPGNSAFIFSSSSVFPVVATPYIYASPENLNKNEYVFFYPAGGIYPESGTDGRLFLKWEDGYAAEIIYRMVSNGHNVDSLNIGRLKRYLIEKSSGNPWIFDEENIVYALSFNIFNANFVKKKKSYNITLEMPFEVPGVPEKRWLLSNFCDSRIFEENNGTLVLDNMPERNIFILSDTGKESAELFIDSAGWHAYFSNRQEILSGRW